MLMEKRILVVLIGTFVLANLVDSNRIEKRQTCKQDFLL